MADVVARRGDRTQPSDLPGAPFVPAAVAQRWLDVHGDRAHAWLGGLASEIEAASRRWAVAIEGPLAGGSVSVVVAGSRAGEPVVMKLAAPWSRWSAAEAAALSAWRGSGAATLLDASADGRELLLHRILPGVPPTRLEAEEVGRLILRLGAAEPELSHVVPELEHAVVQRFDRARENRHGFATPTLIGRACSAGVDLARRPARRPGLVHGDLLTKNILMEGDSTLLAIDPNPARGDTVYDAALWAVTEPPLDELEARTQRLAAVLEVDPAAIMEWALVLAVAEVCLAPRPRAEATLRVLGDRRPEWWR